MATSPPPCPNRQSPRTPKHVSRTCRCPATGDPRRLTDRWASAQGCGRRTLSREGTDRDGRRESSADRAVHQAAAGQARDQRDLEQGLRSPLQGRSAEEERRGRAITTGVAMLADYQARLAAQDTYGVLMCLQAMDAGGKDGAIRHVMSGVNPQGVHVSSFKVPSAEELDHDFLWRYASRLPARGDIAIFNRSHYEEVLVVRVHPRTSRSPEAAKGRQGQRHMGSPLSRDQQLGALSHR